MAKKKYNSQFKIKLMKKYYKRHWGYTDLCKHYHVSILLLEDWRNLVYFWGYSALRAQSQQRFSMKFRLKVVKYYLSHSEGYAVVAGRFKLSYTNVQEWVKKYKLKGVSGLKARPGRKRRTYYINKHNKLSQYRAENAKLRAQNRDLLIDHEILKAAAGDDRRSSKESH